MKYTNLLLLILAFITSVKCNENIKWDLDIKRTKSEIFDIIFREKEKEYIWSTFSKNDIADIILSVKGCIYTRQDGTFISMNKKFIEKYGIDLDSEYFLVTKIRRKMSINISPNLFVDSLVDCLNGTNSEIELKKLARRFMVNAQYLESNRPVSCNGKELVSQRELNLDSINFYLNQLDKFITDIKAKSLEDNLKYSKKGNKLEDDLVKWINQYEKDRYFKPLLLDKLKNFSFQKLFNDDIRCLESFKEIDNQLYFYRHKDKKEITSIINSMTKNFLPFPVSDHWNNEYYKYSSKDDLFKEFKRKELKYKYYIFSLKKYFSVYYSSTALNNLFDQKELLSKTKQNDIKNILCKIREFSYPEPKTLLNIAIKLLEDDEEKNCQELLYCYFKLENNSRLKNLVKRYNLEELLRNLEKQTIKLNPKSFILNYGTYPDELLFLKSKD